VTAEQADLLIRATILENTLAVQPWLFRILRAKKTEPKKICCIIKSWNKFHYQDRLKISCWIDLRGVLEISKEHVTVKAAMAVFTAIQKSTVTFANQSVHMVKGRSLAFNAQGVDMAQ
jgi:hypothetical protein